MSQKAVRILVKSAPNEYVWYFRHIGCVLNVTRRGGYFHYAELLSLSKRLERRMIPIDSPDIVAL